MESKIWSTYIQGAEMLYRTRSIRYRDEYRGQYLKTMGLKDGMDILEVGCGPGALCLRLKEWLPQSSITGLDRDENFVEYARTKNLERGLNCRFVQGDATCMPFEGNMFDACTSYTVSEHIPARPFLSEQYRICKPGGVVSVMSVRNEASVKAEDWLPPGDEEQELWNRAGELYKECDRQYKVCAYPCSVPDIPRHMEETGFVDVCVDFIAVTQAPDSAQYDMALRKEFIETRRLAALDGIELIQNYAPGLWSKGEADRLRELVNSRFDERLRALETGKRLWDISASMLMVVRGYKPQQSTEN